MTFVSIIDTYSNMKLEEYMATQKMTDESFGEQIGRSRIQVFKYRHGVQMPRPEIMKKISAATGGHVTASDFYTSSSGDQK